MLGNRDSHEMLEIHKMIEAEVTASKRQESPERPDIQAPPSLKDIVNDAPKAGRPQMPSPEEAAKFDVDNATPEEFKRWNDNSARIYNDYRSLPKSEKKFAVPPGIKPIGDSPAGFTWHANIDKIRKPISAPDILSNPAIDAAAVRDLSNLDTDWAIRNGYVDKPKRGEATELILKYENGQFIPINTSAANRAHSVQATGYVDKTNPPDALAHLHPSFNKEYDGTPSQQDIAVLIRQKKPSVIQYRETPQSEPVISVLEFSDGRFQARLLSGKLTPAANRAFQRRINYYQQIAQTIKW